MKTICAWCGKELSSESGDSLSDGLVSHGICNACPAEITSQSQKTMRDFLESLNEPVFLGDEAGVIATANSRARAIVGKDASQVDDRLGGDVFEFVVTIHRLVRW